jgi:hypothetical protein
MQDKVTKKQVGDKSFEKVEKCRYLGQTKIPFVKKLKVD